MRAPHDRTVNCLYDSVNPLLSDKDVSSVGWMMPDPPSAAEPLRQRLPSQNVDVALEVQQLVEMRGLGVAKDGLLQVVDRLLDRLEQREVRVNHLVHDVVEEEVGAVAEEARVARQPVTDVIDGL